MVPVYFPTVSSNPLDATFVKYCKLFLDAYFKPNNDLNINYYWFRVENQARGTAHVHGCFKLMSDPGISNLCEIVRDGRIALRKLSLAGLRTSVDYPSWMLEDDRFVPRRKLEQKNIVIKSSYTNAELNALNSLIEKGLIAEEKVCLYNDFLFSTFNEQGPSDVLYSVRDESTKFVQTRTNTHPSGMDHIIAKEMCVNVRNDHYCSLVNAVQRHLCSNYCGGNKEGISCRFGFPMKCQDRTHLAIKEHIVTKRSKDASSNVLCTVNTL